MPSYRVGEDVGSVERGDSSASIDASADHRVALEVSGAVSVVVEGRCVSVGGIVREIGRCARAWPGDGTLPERPAMVGPATRDVDHFPTILADVADPQFPGDPVEGHSPRIAQAHGPELRADLLGIHRFAEEVRGAHEGIVGRDGVVGGDHPGLGRIGLIAVGKQRSGAEIHIEPEDAGEEFPVDTLAVLVAVVATALVS